MSILLFEMLQRAFDSRVVLQLCKPVAPYAQALWLVCNVQRGLRLDPVGLFGAWNAAAEAKLLECLGQA